MNRKLLVTLLHKNIEELSMITESFMEMNEYPQAIVHLAKRKTEDIQTIIDQLAEVQLTASTQKIPDIAVETPRKEVEIEDTKPTFTVEVPTKVETIQQPEEIVSEKPEETVLQPEDVVGNVVVEPDPIPEVSLDVVEDTVVVETEEERKLVIESRETVEVTATKDNHETRVVTEEIKKTTIADKVAPQVVSRNELLSKSDNSLSATIANKKIEDIKQAISIGDRFRFQRELFKGNGEDMNKTLSYINQLATFNEVFSFLQSKYGWDEANAAVEDFMSIVKRKFL